MTAGVKPFKMYTRSSITPLLKTPHSSLSSTQIPSPPDAVPILVRWKPKVCARATQSSPLSPLDRISCCSPPRWLLHRHAGVLGVPGMWQTQHSCPRALALNSSHCFECPFRELLGNSFSIRPALITSLNKQPLFPRHPHTSLAPLHSEQPSFSDIRNVYRVSSLSVSSQESISSKRARILSCSLIRQPRCLDQWLAPNRCSVNIRRTKEWISELL